MINYTLPQPIDPNAANETITINVQNLDKSFMSYD